MNAKISKPAPREVVAQRMLLGGVLLGGAVGAASVVLDQLGISLPRPVLAVAALVAIPVAIWAGLVHWRNIDEAAREAHKFAWFWGATGGMLLALPIIALTDTAKLEALFGPGDASHWVFIGLASMLMLQIAGYVLVWAGWWLVRRR